MTLTEGVRAILATGVLLQEGLEECEDKEPECRSTQRCVRGAGGPVATLEYFNSQAGTWETIRTERDW